jgi:phosphoribosyl-AMP cyclohydrolase
VSDATRNVVSDATRNVVSDATRSVVSDALLDQVAFDANGLVAAIAQQHDSGEVLMLAWMNRAALAETLSTGQACYYSRSRQRSGRPAAAPHRGRNRVAARPDRRGLPYRP